MQRVKLDRSQAASAPAVGDVLRACTCTTFVFPTNSLFGAKPPQRHIVCYGADQQKWTQVRRPGRCCCLCEAACVKQPVMCATSRACATIVLFDVGKLDVSSH